MFLKSNKLKYFSAYLDIIRKYKNCLRLVEIFFKLNMDLCKASTLKSGEISNLFKSF